jgi:hypothetical protein
MADPAALSSKDTIVKKPRANEGSPFEATTIPAKPVKATLIIIPGFDKRIVETTILDGAFSVCSMIFMCF